MRNTISIIFRAIIICGVSTVLGIIYNTISPNRITLFGEVSALSTTTLPIISLEEAKEKFKTMEAIFVDARLPQNYTLGHIEGAINIPYKDFENKYLAVADFLPLDMEIIVYCSGSECKASNIVAKSLSNLGYKKVKIFAEGLDKWEKVGFPVEKDENEYKKVAYKN